jgi:uncharacterized protein with PIN domain
VKYLLDTCIIAAILNQEQGHRHLEDRIVAAPRGSLHISAITAVEVWIGLARPRTPRAWNYGIRLGQLHKQDGAEVGS